MLKIVTFVSVFICSVLWTHEECVQVINNRHVLVVQKIQRFYALRSGTKLSDGVHKYPTQHMAYFSENNSQAPPNITKCKVKNIIRWDSNLVFPNTKKTPSHHMFSHQILWIWFHKPSVFSVFILTCAFLVHLRCFL